MAFAGPNNTGSYIATNNIWDPSVIYASNLTPELKEILVRMYQNLGLMSTNVNLKDTGYYPTQEFVNGQLFYPNTDNNSASPGKPAYRQVYRTTVNFGALPNNATPKGVDHGITMTPGFTFTRIYGCATNPTTQIFIPIPYTSAGATNNENLELYVDSTQVVVTSGGFDYSGYTTTYIIVEYLKS